jgi:hypothetical protein
MALGVVGETGPAAALLLSCPGAFSEDAVRRPREARRRVGAFALFALPSCPVVTAASMAAGGRARLRKRHHQKG